MHSIPADLRIGAILPSMFGNTAHHVVDQSPLARLCCERHEPPSPATRLCRSSAGTVGAQPRKNLESHIDASLSRQPLVKGERLVRFEVNAVMAYGAARFMVQPQPGRNQRARVFARSRDRAETRHKRGATFILFCGRPARLQQLNWPVSRPLLVYTRVGDSS